MIDDRPAARTRRARLLVVGSGDDMRELASLARRRISHVVEVPTLFDAVDECKRASAAEPIAGVFISPDCEHYEARAVADAFMRVDPAAPLILAVRASQDDLTAASTGEGFEDSIRLPARDEELARILADLGLSDAVPAPQPAPQPPAPPQPRNVVEEIVERAQERRRLDEPVRGAAPPHGTRPPRAAGPVFQMPAARPTAPAFGGANPSDLDLIRAVSDGHDVQGTAMRVLRFHIGSQDVHFVPEVRPGEEQAAERDRRGVRQARVARADGTPFGLVISRAIDEHILAFWANWLASWLEFAESHQELRRLAWTDELTGAGNRRAFDRLLAESIQSAHRDWRSFGLMLFDIDDFKRYNDTFGHETGDEVLKEIVELLRSCVRRGDHIFRIGGDEFAVLFCDPDGPRRGGTIDRDSAGTIASRFQRAVAELSLTHIGLEGPGTVTVSTGFAAFPWHGLEPAALYRSADQYCLDSKRAGKNRITFGPGMSAGDAAGLP